MCFQIVWIQTSFLESSEPADIHRGEIYSTFMHTSSPVMDNFTAELLASATLSVLHPNQTQLLAKYVMQMNRNIVIQPHSTFNVSTYIRNYLTEVQIAASWIATSDQADWDCIRRVLTPRFNKTRLSLIIQQYSTIRLCVSTLDRVCQFLRNFAQRNFTIPSKCADSFIGLYCVRCRESSVQLLCRNVCGALVKACYSPFYTGLNEQFEVLWNVSRQVLTITNSTVNALAGQSGGFGTEPIDVLVSPVVTIIKL